MDRTSVRRAENSVQKTPSILSDFSERVENDDSNLRTSLRARMNSLDTLITEKNDNCIDKTALFGSIGSLNNSELCASLLQAIPATVQYITSQWNEDSIPLVGDQEALKSKYIDPESPSNLQNFIGDISRLGSKNSEWTPALMIASSGSRLPTAPVLGHKREWKKKLRADLIRQ
jgi:hypothetical protein